MGSTIAPISPEGIPTALLPAISALCSVGRSLSRQIARGPLGASLGRNVGTNTGGDGQKALDVLADTAFAAALSGTGVRYFASEEREEIVELEPTGHLALAIDPLDGSSNIDVNVSIGTIFSIYEACGGAEASFLRRVRDQIAAGYIIYGPQTSLIVTFGQGVRYYTLDPETQVFELAQDHLCLPEQSGEFAINASNYRHWPVPIRAYIDDCLAGEEGPHARNYNMRWIASLVAETHRILTRGGLFLYPGDARRGYTRGRLRMLYECAPIAFVIEQAGGKASDGLLAIMDQRVEDLHERVPLIFGSPAQMDRVTVYHDLPPAETSALFSERSLFRV
ncbi:class 1 fructose-bisphosphatase [Sedimentimonas flavescens]|uniref:class 1 fructose-bisphosphatase n=1 Tax=Sedimentimonas flavescens TaxID=2851012 RepID=UPI001C4A30F3|nr:class 1 fructose-bisphosphatase [Sedimentimonas flavescens]MBW0158308.1 class 1 fructose-bisphosphatase [Sedimentimonas flavescens]